MRKQAVTALIPIGVARRLEKYYHAQIDRLTARALAAEGAYIDAYDRAVTTPYELDAARQKYELALLRLGKVINEFNNEVYAYLWQEKNEAAA